MTLQIEFPGPNEQGVIVIRMMVIGSVGYGKTTLMQSLAPEIAPQERWVVVSPVDALANRLGVENHKVFGRDKEACERFFGNLIHTGESVLLLIDEFDEYCPGGVVGSSGGYSCESLYRIINYARNKDPTKAHGNEIAVFVSSRGTADITTNSIRAMDIVFFGQMWEGNAIKYLRSSVRQGDIDFERIVRNLPKFVFMVWCPQAGGFQGFVEVHEDGTWTEWEPDDLDDAEAEPSSSASESPPPSPTPESSPPRPESTAS